MMNKMKTEAAPRLVLRTETATDRMMPNPVSVRDIATVAEAVALLTDKGFSGAPVIDEAGRPVGVLSRADIVAHDRERVQPPAPATDVSLHLEPSGGGSRAGKIDSARVRDLMTPAVFSVAPATSASKVVAEMLALNVHRLFVVDSSGVLIGVITALDVLRHLQPEL